MLAFKLLAEFRPGNGRVHWQATGCRSMAGLAVMGSSGGCEWVHGCLGAREGKYTWTGEVVEATLMPAA